MLCLNICLVIVKWSVQSEEYPSFRYCFNSLQIERPKIGWCVGSNPPFVVCGIRLIGLPAPSGRDFIGAVCPFHLQDGRFIASTPANSTSLMCHCQVWVDVSFLLRCQASQLAPKGCCNSTCGRSFLRPKFGSDSHTPTRQPVDESTKEANKHDRLVK
jgi:hypothetical protein